MSKKKTIINLTPPGRIRTEGFISKGHICGYCNGKGWFYSNLHQDNIEQCPDCGGSGEVMAFVTVEWKPATSREKV